MAVAKGDKSPQNDDDDGDDQATAVHEQMIEEDVHDHRAEKYEPQRYVAIRQQQCATREFHRRQNEIEMRLD